MKIPTEEQIQAVVSELDADSCGNKPDPDQKCETCQFLGEFDKRGKEHPTQIDQLLINAMEKDPRVMIGTNIGGLMIFCNLMRAAFFIGVKVGIAQETAKSLEDLMEK